MRRIGSQSRTWLRAVLVAVPVGLAAMGALAAGDGGAPGAAAPTRAAVQARLATATHGLSARDVADLGSGGGGLLARIADDKTVGTPIRLRAMAALAYARAPATHDFLETYLARQRSSRDPVDRALLRKAAIALGWQSGPRTVETLAELLDHDDPEVRLDVAVALGLTRTRRAEKPLRDRLAVEADPAVRSQIDSQLRILLGPEAGAAAAR